MDHKPNCPICRSGSDVRLEDEPLRIFRCASCKHDFTFSEKRENYDEDYYAKTHERWFKNPNVGLFAAIDREVRRLLPGSAIRLLDVGCGNGDFLKYLADRDPSEELSGIDLVGNVDPRIRYYRGDFLEFDCPPRKYNVLTGLAVVEHVDDPRKFIEKANGCLEPGGLLALMTVNSGGLLYRTARTLRRIGLRAGYDRLYSSHHLEHYTNLSLKKALEAEGFGIESVKNHNFPREAVDVPAAGPLSRAAFRAFVSGVFLLSDLTGSGMLQTVVCRKIR